MAHHSSAFLPHPPFFFYSVLFNFSYSAKNLHTGLVQANTNKVFPLLDVVTSATMTLDGEQGS